MGHHLRLPFPIACFARIILGRNQIVIKINIGHNFGGGGVQQQKRSCRREKPKMSFVLLFFFVLFQNTFKIDVFVPNLVKNVSSKKNKKDHDFRIF